MSECTDVERPFLDKLRQFGWKVMDHASATLSMLYLYLKTLQYTCLEKGESVSNNLV